MNIKITGKQIAEKVGIVVNDMPLVPNFGTIKQPKFCLSEEKIHKIAEQDFNDLKPVLKDTSAWRWRTGEIYYHTGFQVYYLVIGRVRTKLCFIELGGDSSYVGNVYIEKISDNHRYWTLEFGGGFVSSSIARIEENQKLFQRMRKQFEKVEIN